jgi:GT2 family glycosyltransferase
VQNKENIGFGKAHNKVFELTNSEYFAIINSDIEFKNNVLKALSDCLGSKEKVAAVSCKLLSPDQSVQENISVFPTLPLELLARIPFVQNPYSPKKDYSLSQEVKSFNGACFLVRRSAIKGKLFDEDYFAYAEETDLFYRLKKIGWKIFFEPKAIAIHYGGASSKKVEAQLLHLNGLKLFFEKNHNKFSEKIFLLICLFSAAVGFFVAFFVSNKERKDFCKRIIKACWKDFL